MKATEEKPVFLQAGFAETEINPQSFRVRTYWATVDTVIDPLFAHAAVFDDGTKVIAFLSLDVVIVEREYVLAIREQVSQARPIPSEHIMVCATHNHACPAVVERPWSQKDHGYLQHMIERAVMVLIEAYDAMVPVEVGTGTRYEGRVSFNRRFIMKNGSVISQPSFDVVKKDVLFAESIIDPEVGVLCVKNRNGEIIGMLVNFACHPVHLIGSLSAGFPGVLCNRLKEIYGSKFVCVFLNGACGNIIHQNYADPGHEDTKERLGTILADNVERIVSGITYRSQAKITVESCTVKLRYREIDGLERNMNKLTTFNVFQSLIENNWYPWSLKKLKGLHAKSDHEEAEIQVLRIGDTVFGAIPAEYFSQHSLRIKEDSPISETFLVSLANGWLGYIPHREAFDRIGGHESTWCFSSKMEPEAGDHIAGALLALIIKMAGCEPTSGAGG